MFVASAQRFSVLHQVPTTQQHCLACSQHVLHHSDCWVSGYEWASYIQWHLLNYCACCAVFLQSCKELAAVVKAAGQALDSSKDMDAAQRDLGFAQKVANSLDTPATAALTAAIMGLQKQIFEARLRAGLQ
jgi:hypothetical protein